MIIDDPQKCNSRCCNREMQKIIQMTELKIQSPRAPLCPAAVLATCDAMLCLYKSSYKCQAISTCLQAACLRQRLHDCRLNFSQSRRASTFQVVNILKHSSHLERSTLRALADSPTSTSTLSQIHRSSLHHGRRHRQRCGRYGPRKF